MGPWTHGAWAAPEWTKFGTHEFGYNINKFYRDSLETAFFNYYLKDKGQFNIAEATVYETGNNRWRNFNQWPPAESKQVNYYLQDAGKLSTSKPTGNNKYPLTYNSL